VGNEYAGHDREPIGSEQSALNSCEEEIDLIVPYQSSAFQAIRTLFTWGLLNFVWGLSGAPMAHLSARTPKLW
jgi:hypothetical protein